MNTTMPKCLCDAAKGYVNKANAMKWCHLSDPGASIFCGSGVSVPIKIKIVNINVIRSA